MNNFRNPSDEWQSRLEAMNAFLSSALCESLRQPLTSSGVQRSMELHNRMCAFGTALNAPGITASQGILALETFALAQYSTQPILDNLAAQADTVAKMAAKLEQLEIENHKLRQFAVSTSSYVLGRQSDQLSQLRRELDDLRERLLSTETT